MNCVTINRGIAAVILGMFSSVIFGETRASAQIATFEDYAEGVVATSFVDPTSGILFTNPIYSFGEGIFALDYAGPTNLPALPGNHLTCNGYSPGPGLGLTGGSGFTFILPTPSTYLQMDEIYFPGFGFSYSIEVTAYATNGQQILQTNVLLPGNFPHIGIAHSVFLSATPMSRIVVTTPLSAAVGFDNIGTPPLIQSIVATNQVLVLTAKYAPPQAQLLSSSDLEIWSPAMAAVTNDSGSTIFTVPITESRAFFRLQQ